MSETIRKAESADTVPMCEFTHGCKTARCARRKNEIFCASLTSKSFFARYMKATSPLLGLNFLVLSVVFFAR